MIITFATQKGGAGKTTLAIAFANYLSGLTERKLNVFDFDYQKSFYNKWIEDENSNDPKIYDVELLGEDNEKPFEDLEKLFELKDSDEINIFDLAGTLDQKYSDLLNFKDTFDKNIEYNDVEIDEMFTFLLKK